MTIQTTPTTNQPTQGGRRVETTWNVNTAGGKAKLTAPVDNYQGTGATTIAKQLRARGMRQAATTRAVNARYHSNIHYNGADLLPFIGRAGANQALSLPSRVGDHRHYRDGYVEHSPIAPKIPALVYGV